MSESYLILTPILMLGVLGLARFVGCDIVWGLDRPSADPAEPAEEEFVVATALGEPRNDFTGWVGMAIDVGSRSIRITELGRSMLFASTQPHEVKLVRPAGEDGADLGSVTILPTSELADFAYATLATPVILTAGQRYYVVTHEAAGGDSWHHRTTTVTTTEAAEVASGVFQYEGDPRYQFEGAAGNTYGPVDFKYFVES